MATGLLALLDDIAALMDDTAAMTKIAAQKTAGIVGDDLAVNTEALLGINPRREIAIVAKVARGSLVNKAILIPAALGISAVAPGVIPYALMAGGLFLCYEAVHKVFYRPDPAQTASLAQATAVSEADMLAIENKKIKQAITTDFILSAEIVIVALGTFAGQTLQAQALSLTVLGLAMTVGVYGAVAGLVKLDDLGLWMLARRGHGRLQNAVRRAGGGLVRAVPWLMKGLGIVGTAAMFAVGGGILLHGVPAAGHAVETAVASLPALQGLASFAAQMAAGFVAGLAAAGVWRLAGPYVARLKRPQNQP